jgi:hypothetical protein
VKLKFAIELKIPDTNPGLPDAEDETTYGINVWPSNKTEEACPNGDPNDESRTLPDISNIRSLWMIPCALYCFWSGTIVSWEMALVPPRVEPCVVQTRPFQADKKEELPSVELW